MELSRLRTALSLGVFASLLVVSAASNADVAKLSVEAGMGPNPTLPEPVKSLIPTGNVAEAQGWKDNSKPTPAPGFAVLPFARDLDHPRWIYVLPNGDVLVAESNSPPKPDDAKGIKGLVSKHLQKKAGAVVPSRNHILLFRDTNGDGIADEHTVFIDNLNSPFGMVLVGADLYVADTDALLRFPYNKGDGQITAAGIKVTDLPAGTINHHWTKNVIARADGSKLYVTVGSNSNVAENGLPAEEGRAAIWEVDPKNGAHRIFASGLRNPNGLAWDPDSGELWTTVNERDELGSDLVPDYMTAVHDGAFYGWPFSYYGKHVDDRVSPQNPALVAKAVVPDYALGPHTASLGLAASNHAALLPAQYGDGMFIGQHGSWNRNPRSGYKVIFVPFTQGKPSGKAVDVLTGFLTHEGKASGRPVGVAIDAKGALLVADDVGNAIWRVSKAK